MNNKKIYLLALLLLVCILSISTISATENTTNKEICNTNNKENNLETNNHYDDVSNSNNNDVELKEKKDTYNNDKQDKSGTDETTTTENEDPLSFTDLNITINGNSNSTIYLSNNYTYNDDSDSGFTAGILINRDLTIYGNGVTIDGNKMARIFNVTDSKLNVNFYNINFINGQAVNGGAIYSINNTYNVYNCTFTGNSGSEGGAIYKGNAYNCTFTENTVTFAGGAMAGGNAYNCIFISNTVTDGGYGGGAIYESNAYNCTFTGNAVDNAGGAIYKGNAYNCTFKGNTASRGGAMCDGKAFLCRFNGDTISWITPIPAIINVINYTSTYKSGERLKFNLTADDILFDGFNTTINIYKNGVLIKTVYGLTGEGWIVDLEPGEYTAELSLTDYPEENATNATITVDNKENTYIVITPIDNVKVGQEITIHYTTNSNGTVTIKVNGQEIKDGKFTPTTAGTYNLTIDVAENDYYTAGSNETIFTVGKAGSKIIASPVTTTYKVDKYLKITLKDQYGKAIKNAVLTVNLGGAKKYKTDKNGQIKINVATLTPKTYNAKITYAGSNNYNASTSSVKITVKKATPKIAAKSAIYKLKLKTKKYPVIIKNNKNKALKNTKVTLKVNGKTFNVKTNSKGLGVFKITNLKKKGIYIAVITVPTNKYYNKISKKMKIAVKS